MGTFTVQMLPSLHVHFTATDVVAVIMEAWSSKSFVTLKSVIIHTHTHTHIQHAHRCSWYTQEMQLVLFSDAMQ